MESSASKQSDRQTTTRVLTGARSVACATASAAGERSTATTLARDALKQRKRNTTRTRANVAAQGRQTCSSFQCGVDSSSFQVSGLKRTAVTAKSTHRIPAAGKVWSCCGWRVALRTHEKRPGLRESHPLQKRINERSRFQSEAIVNLFTAASGTPLCAVCLLLATLLQHEIDIGFPNAN